MDYALKEHESSLVVAMICEKSKPVIGVPGNCELVSEYRALHV